MAKKKIDISAHQVATRHAVYLDGSHLVFRFGGHRAEIRINDEQRGFAGQILEVREVVVSLLQEADIIARRSAIVDALKEAIRPPKLRGRRRKVKH